MPRGAPATTRGAGQGPAARAAQEPAARAAQERPGTPIAAGGRCRFEVVGDPKGQPRPRAFRRGARAGVYAPAGPHKGWRDACYTVAERYRPDHPAEGPVAARLDFKFARPKSHLGTGRNAGIVKRSAPVDHAHKPDLDNMIKLVLDVLTQLGFWHDDSQVAALVASKCWAEPGEAPGVTVEVTHG